MTIENQYNNEENGIEQEFEDGLIDEDEYIQRMKDLEEEGRQFEIFNDN